MSTPYLFTFHMMRYEALIHINESAPSSILRYLVFAFLLLEKRIWVFQLVLNFIFYLYTWQ